MNGADLEVAEVGGELGSPDRVVSITEDLGVSFRKRLYSRQTLNKDATTGEFVVGWLR
jgi:hypothetical protein